MDKFDIQIAHSVEEVGDEAWDALSAGRPFQSARWYRFGERVMEDCQPLYIILSQGGKDVARGTFWVVRNEPLPVSPLIRAVLRPIFRRWPLVICRIPIIDLSGLVLPADPGLRAASQKAISCAAQQETSRHQASFILFPYLEPEVARAQGWPLEFNAIDLPGPGTCLRIVWSDFTTYLNLLPQATKKYYRYNHHHALDWDILVQREKEIIISDDVLSFIRNVEKHHQAAPNPWVPAILENASMVDATWFVARARGKVAGCLLTFKEQEDSLLNLIGLDYNVPHTYFQLLYAAIGFAIENRTQVLWGGTGAYTFKQSMGFELTANTWAVFAGRQPFMQKAGSILAKWAR